MHCELSTAARELICKLFVENRNKYRGGGGEGGVRTGGMSDRLNRADIRHFEPGRMCMLFSM